MEGKVNYTVVGIFVVALSAFLTFIIIWMSVVGDNRLYRTYLVFVHEDVTGLSAESPVRFNGVKVGYVKSIHLDPTNPKLVRLELSIEPKIPITTSTYAILNAQGVTGVVYVNLKAETETAPLLVATAGHRFPVIPSKPSLLMQLSTVLPEVTTDIQHLSASIAEVLDTQNRDSIKTSLKNIATITSTLASNSQDFTSTLHSLDNSLANISEASNHLPMTVTQLNKTLDSVNQLSSQMTQTAKTINNTMQSGQTVIHNFSDQIMSSEQATMNNMSAATVIVQHLTTELDRNPSMLVRGKHPAQLGPGEK